MNKHKAIRLVLDTDYLPSLPARDRIKLIQLISACNSDDMIPGLLKKYEDKSLNNQTK